MASKAYLVTGANTGLGWDTCRQLALRQDTEKVYLACRSKDRAIKAIEALVSMAGCDGSKLEFVPFDASTSKEEIRRSTIQSIAQKQRKIHGLVLNAGGPGGDGSGKPTSPNNVLDIVQINIIAHIQLVELMRRQGLLVNDCHIIYSGSESARGYLASTPYMGDTPQHFQDFVQGKSYKVFYNVSNAYGTAKGIAALYFAKYARLHPAFQIFTVSPGATFGTKILFQKSIAWSGWFVYILWWILSRFGLMHQLEEGAARYVQAVTGEYDSKYSSGAFIASARMAVGLLCDQTQLPGGRQYGDQSKQDAAYEALKPFL